MQGEQIAGVRVSQWATPRPGLSLQDLVLKLNADGVTVLDIDHGNNRVLISQETTWQR